MYIKTKGVKIMFKRIKKYFIKSISVVAASSVLLSSTTAQAINFNDLSDFGKSIINRTKKIYDENTTVCNSAIAVLAAILLYTIFSGKHSEKTNIDKEIKKYKNRASDVFEIEDNVIKETDPQVLLRTLIQLNKLFDEYTDFTKELIKTKKSNKYNKKFTIRLVDNQNENTIASAYINLDGINLSRKYYTNKKSWDTLKNSVHSNYNSPRDDDKIIEGAISHEFSHVMEFLYISKQIAMPWEYYNSPTCKNFFDNRISEESEAIKTKIINKTNKKDIAKDISKDLGEYAKKNALEFFAEAFATMQCSTDSKYKYIQSAVKKVISNWF